MRYQRTTAIACLFAVGVATIVLLAGAGSAVADEHTQDHAVDVTDEANFTATFPFRTDHYPGDGNEENGSIQYYFSPEDSFAELGIEDQGAFGHYLVIDAPWIDYSACQVDNTAVFGIDRGNNNSGTNIDEDLIQRMKRNEFRDDGLLVEFMSWDDIYDPPYMAAEDAIVAEQGARSSGGACLTTTNEPGWYRIRGFLNGTAADNGPDERPSADAETVAGTAFSNYIYICECDSEAEARDELGPPPNERDGTPTPTPVPETDTPTPGDVDTATPTEPPETEPPQTEPPETEPPETEPTQGTQPPRTDPPRETEGNGNGPAQTPTASDGPGFTGIAALVALLASGLIALRRR